MYAHIHNGFYFGQFDSGEQNKIIHAKEGTRWRDAAKERQRERERDEEEQHTIQSLLYPDTTTNVLIKIPLARAHLHYHFIIA